MLRFFPACCLVYLLAVLGVVPLWAAPPESVPPKSAPPKSAPLLEARSYHARLQRAEDAFTRMENGAPRTGAGDIVQSLSAPPEFKLRRADGETMGANSYEWQRRLGSISSKRIVSREAVRDLRLAVNRRRVALEEWISGRNGQLYEAADAQDIMRQLESTGQIRSGPTRWQKMWADLTRSIGQGITKLFDTIIGWLGSNAPPATNKAPNIDTRWITFFFYSTVLSLLAVLGYLLWRTLGGRLGREGARREVRYLQSEDAELLLLPPDELRQRAERFAAEGDFRQALRHMYLSLLLQLDSRGVWRYDTRRTNWEHIRALRRNAQGVTLIDPLADITRRFDRVRYGDAPCSAQDWSRFATDVQEVQRLADDNKPRNTAASRAETASGARS
ncbi:MAG TPA: DUF4129 domain-containing protein [Abditibacteriaceae bacterium]|jgi:hypothetical protein